MKRTLFAAFLAITALHSSAWADVGPFQIEARGYGQTRLQAQVNAGRAAETKATNRCAKLGRAVGRVNVMVKLAKKFDSYDFSCSWNGWDRNLAKYPDPQPEIKECKKNKAWCCTDNPNHKWIAPADVTYTCR